jgi:hypothetical protein
LKHHKREGRQAAIKDEKLGERKELQQINILYTLTNKKIEKIKKEKIHKRENKKS